MFSLELDPCLILPASLVSVKFEAVWQRKHNSLCVEQQTLANSLWLNLLASPDPRKPNQTNGFQISAYGNELD